MHNNAPIGIFDSGVGGTSIWKEIAHHLPNENSIYLADSKHAPYGTKSAEDILALCIKNTELLIKKGAKIIVVACNTATTNAIRHLRATYDIPFIGIEPAIKPAALHSKTNAIGILATRGTLNSSLFEATSRQFANDKKVIEVIGEGLVPLIENNEIATEEIKTLLRLHLQPMLKAQIDYLVLGCSHYPYLIPVLKELLPKDVKIIDSGEAVARQTAAILKKYLLLGNTASPTHLFYSNTAVDTLKDLVMRGTAFAKAQPTFSYLDF